MYESNEQYREIVRREVLVLEKTHNCKISNGEAGFCPRCGKYGIWDIATRGFIRNYGNSIYYSTVFNEWRCNICESKRPVKRSPAFAGPNDGRVPKRSVEDAHDP